MKTAYRKTFGALWILVTLCLATVSDAQELPSLNYWEISYQLSRFDQVRDVLEISPYQKNAIAKMRADPKWDTIFLQKELELQTKREAQFAREMEALNTEKLAVRQLAMAINRPTIYGSGLRDAYVAANELVKVDLEKILNADQMAVLVRVMLRARFESGVQPLNDKEVRDVCQLRVEELSKQVRAKLAQLESEYQAKLERLRKESLLKIVDSLPAATKQRFVNIASNKYAPDNRVEPNVSDVPGSGLMGIDLLVGDLELRRQLNLTQKQIDQLQGVNVRLNAVHELAERRKPNNLNSETLKTEMLNRKAETERSIAEILTQQQKGDFQRYKANLLFERDCRKPFNIESFAQYIEPDAKLLASHLRTATIERESLLKKIREADQQVFLASCDLLPSHSSEILKKLFEDVWKLDVEGFKWENLH